MKEENENDAITVTKLIKLIVYVFVMFILAIILFTLCLKSILKYNEWPIYTETNIVGQNEARFPAMTFCALPNGYKEDVLKVSLWIMLLQIGYSFLKCTL